MPIYAQTGLTVERGAQACSCQCHANLSFIKFAGNNSSPMDADAIVYGVIFQPSLGRFILERKDRFVLIEAKKPGEQMQDGQRKCLEAISRLPQWKVIVMILNGGDPVSMQEVRNNVWFKPIAVNKSIVSQYFAGWFHRVNRNGSQAF